MSGLFDTGAEVTLGDVTLSGADQWTKVPFVNIPVTVDGTPLRVKGAVRVNLEVDGIEVPDHVIYLVEGLGVSCLLGTDVMARLPGVIELDPRRKVVTIRPRVPSQGDDLKGEISSEQAVKVDTAVPVEENARPGIVGRVRLAKPAVVPAGHEVLLRAEVDPTVAKAGGSCLLEPYRSLSKKEGLIGARALVVPDGSVVQVRVLNVSGRPISLKAGMAVGSVEVLPSDPVVSSVIEDDADLDVMAGRPNEVTGSEAEMVDSMVEGAEISETERQDLRSNLQRNRDVFSMQGELGCTSVVEHNIHTSDDHPIRQQPRRVPHHLLGEVDKQLTDMLDKGLIQESSSPWASPVVLVKKKNGEVRFCIDYRQLNQKSCHDAYPVPRVDDALRCLRGARWFSTLDLASAYWQILMDSESSRKAAFTTHRGLFEPKRMPFGLRSAPATMQRLMMTLFGSMTWQTVLVYLDDIVIFSNTVEQHLARMDSVFAKIREANLKLKPAKCVFLRKSVEYLGHTVSEQGIATSPRVVQAVQNYQVPRDVPAVRRFLGLTGYYRQFVPHYADIAEPLNRLTRKLVRFSWDEECASAFQELKRLVVSAPVLHFPDFSLQFHLTTDASEVGIAGVLSQLQDGRDCPVGYYSSSLSPAQRNYSATERECLAIVEAIRHFDMFLAGAAFVIHTDHRPLSYLHALKEPRGRLARWILFLDSYEFEIKYKPGVDIPHADALSRAVPERVMTTLLEPQWSPEVLSKAQEDDPVVGKVKYLVRMGKDAKYVREREVLDLWKQRERLSLTEQGVLVVKSPRGNTQVVLPAQLVEEVLMAAHDPPASGHLASEKMLQKVRERFYWPTLFRDVSRYCRTCISCQSRKDPGKTRSAPLQSMPIPTRPFEFVSIDHTGPLPRTAAGNKYILVLSCHFSKWVECFPVATMEASLVADVLVREVVCRYGVPSRLHSDQGRSFEAAVIKNMCRALKIEKSRTSTYHPEGNGQTERYNSTAKTMLSHYVDQLDQRDWDLYLPLVLFAYRTSVHATTHFSPYELLFCRQPNIPLDCLIGPQVPSQIDDPIGKVLELQEEIPGVMKMVRSYIEAGQETRNNRRDTSDFQPYQVGDQVMVRNSRTKKGLSPKLKLDRWVGPYRVRKAVTDVNYRLQRGRQKILVHYNRMKPFFEPQGRDVVVVDENQTDQTEADTPTEDSGDDPEETEDATGDDCERYDIEDLVLDTVEGVPQADVQADAQAPLLPPERDGGVDRPVNLPGGPPLMREGGKLWCNIDARNVMTGGRRRK